jgi:hypothetical protein
MNDILPNFQEGVLPQGDYKLTIDQLRKSHLVYGHGDSSVEQWDTDWRSHLVDNLEIMVQQLWSLDINRIFIDGSFVEDKDHPNDIDGYFECDIRLLASGKLERDLNLLDADKIWTWDPASRRAYQGYPKKQLPMWHKYRVEMYPHIAGMGCGIQDQYGNELEFPAAFRISRRDDKPKGIIQIIRGETV